MKNLENLESKAFRTSDLLNTEDNKNEGDGYTFLISFATSEPVERYFGKEIVNPSLMDLSRLNNKAIVLFNHDRDKPIGVVEKAWVDEKTNVAKAKIRLDKTNQRAVEIKNSIENGIISKISFGYTYTGSRLLKIEDNEEYYEFATKPFEISIVTIPADDNVGIEEQRNFKELFLKNAKKSYNDNSNTKLLKENLMENKKEISLQEETKQNEEVIVNEVEKTEEVKSLPLSEIQQIKELGEHFKQIDLANDFILLGKSLEEFKTELKNQYKTGARNTMTTMEKNESLGVKLRQALAENRAVNLKLRDFMGTQKTGNGKELVSKKTAPIQDFSNYEDYFRTLGFSVFNSNGGRLTIPVVLGVESEETLAAEGGKVNEAKISTTSVEIPMEKSFVRLKVTSEMLHSTDEHLINVIQTQGLKHIREDASHKILAKLLNADGIKTAQKDFTYNNIIALQADVSTVGDKKYLTTKKTAVGLKTTEAFTNTGKVILEGDTIDGVDTHIIEKLPKGVENEFILYGDLSSHYVGLFGEPELFFNGYPDDDGSYEVKIIFHFGSVLANKKAVSKITAV